MSSAKEDFSEEKNKVVLGEKGSKEINRASIQLGEDIRVRVGDLSMLTVDVYTPTRMSLLLSDRKWNTLRRVAIKEKTIAVM